MRGCLLKAKTKRGLQKGESAWRIIIPFGRYENGKPRQKWITFYGTRQQADAKLADLVGDVNRGEFVEASKLTVSQWLNEWLDKAIKPPRRSNRTYMCWKGLIKNHITPALGHLLLQRLTYLHLEQYYAEAGLKFAPATVAMHHSIITCALSAAVNVGHVRQNVAKRTTNKPRRRHAHEEVLKNVWIADEARQFLSTVRQHGNAQYAALFALALDTGMRRGELLGLMWKDISGTTVRVERQMVTGGLKTPVFELPKGKRARTVDISENTLTLLLIHKREQAEVKMANRTVYRDNGLVFAQAWEHFNSKGSVLGAPLSALTLMTKMDKFCKIAKVKRITPHGLRHTCATLLLSAGVPPHVVQRRLGHADVSMTLGVYSHVLPTQQADAASRLAALLH